MFAGVPIRIVTVDFIVENILVNCVPRYILICTQNLIVLIEKNKLFSTKTSIKK